MPNPHHAASPPYAPPVLRGASPASSIASFHNDQTASDIDLSQAAFEYKWNARIGVFGLMDVARQAEEKEREEQRCGNPLLPEVKTPSDEKSLFEKVLANLREEVRQLEENEEFERALSGPPSVPADALPSSNDLDAIMQSLMMPSAAKDRTSSAGGTARVRPSTAQGHTDHRFMFEMPLEGTEAKPHKGKGKKR